MQIKMFKRKYFKSLSIKRDNKFERRFNQTKKINVKAKSDSHGKPANDLPKNKKIEQSKEYKLRVSLLEEIINLNGDVHKLKKHDVKMREDFNDRNENDVLKLAAIERRKFLTDSILI